MMTDGTLRHARLADNIVAALNAKLAGGPCRAYGHNARVAAWESDAGYYPDVVVDCGPYDAKALAVTAPTVVFEVLSPSTRNSDFAEKVPDYRDTATITQIVLMEPDEPLLYVWTRTNAAWRERHIRGIDALLDLPDLQLSLPLAEIYADV